MPLLIGALLAVFVGLLGTVAGMDRDRAYYTVVAIVVATYYALFAVLGASTHVLLLECLAGALFLALAVTGFTSSLWAVVAALVGHGLFDLAHGAVIANPGVPDWWPPFCMAFDVVAGVYLAWLILSRRVRAAAPDRVSRAAL